MDIDRHKSALGDPRASPRFGPVKLGGGSGGVFGVGALPNPNSDRID